MIPLCIVPHAVTDDALQKLRAEAAQLQFLPATTIDTLGQEVLDHHSRSSYVAEASWIERHSSVVRTLEDLLVAVNASHFHLRISKSFRWQMLKYESGGFHSWHTDWKFSEELSRKLTVVLQISNGDDYMGADLLVNGSEVEVGSRRAGDANVFHGLATHRVTPLMRGSRVVLVGWVLGPHFA
ncbi:2OG-Fe(II) oxygenase [Rhizobium binae]|uniref:2OG-Fe(II) oxygenase n=1 Tax=Rhizobium binae TaxID=1138190 RepID=UPI001C83E32A|nr:2OG-Fe(II) oxygenase [Rhizobium binae]MBX4969031.1 hypothetical protein [Rhizobium binae]